MKQVLKILINIMVIALLIVLPQRLCAQINTLTGTWKVDLNKTIQRMSGAERLRYDSLLARSRASMQDAFEDMTFQFDGNSQVTVITVIKGTSHRSESQWEYEAVNRKLSITKGQRVNEYTVDWDDAVNIHLIYLQPEGHSLLKQLCLTRIN